jgi:hypothetical protein
LRAHAVWPSSASCVLRQWPGMSSSERERGREGMLDHVLQPAVRFATPHRMPARDQGLFTLRGCFARCLRQLLHHDYHLAREWVSYRLIIMQHDSCYTFKPQALPHSSVGCQCTWPGRGVECARCTHLGQVAGCLGKSPRLDRLPATHLTWLTYPQLVQILCFPINPTHS